MQNHTSINNPYHSLPEIAQKDPRETSKSTIRNHALSLLFSLGALAGASLIVGHTIEQATDVNFIPSPSIDQLPSPDINPIAVDATILLIGLTGVAYTTREEK